MQSLDTLDMDLAQRESSQRSQRSVYLLRPPVVRQALNDVSLSLHPDSALMPFFDELERLLMFNVNAPAALDSVPFGTALGRFSILVAAARGAFSENPVFGDMIRRMGPALVKDRAARSDGLIKSEDIVEAVREITRTVKTHSYKPRY